MDNTSRRSILEFCSIGAVAGLAGCVSLQDAVSQSDDTGSQSDTTNEELRARIQELEAIIASKNERIEALHREESISEFSTEVVDQAAAMATDARKAVVTVSGADGSMGTGWVLDARRGYVVTNSHVVVEDDSFTIETFDGDRGSAARIGYYQEMIPDVALLQTDVGGLRELPTGDETALTPEDPVVTIGHPGSVGDWIMTMGRHEEYEAHFDTLLSTVPTARGNSGGPLLTLDGSVVGVVSGERKQEGSDDDFSKSETVYTQLPEIPELTTASSASVLLNSVDEWT